MWSRASSEPACSRRHALPGVAAAVTLGVLSLVQLGACSSTPPRSKAPVAKPEGPLITNGLFWKLTSPASRVATTCADRPSNTSIPPPVGTRMSW